MDGKPAIATQGEITMKTQALTTDRLQGIVVNSGGHAFDTRTGCSYGINPTAQLALQMLQDGASRDEVVSALCNRCSETPSVVGAGVDAFIEQLGRVTK